MKPFLLGLMLLVSSSTFSQLDSVNVELNFISDSLLNADSLIIHQGTFQVGLEVGDLTDFGAAVVKLYNNYSAEPLSIFYASKDDILAQGIFSNEKILIHFPNLDSTMHYLISVNVQNSFMAYLPSISAHYQPN